MARFKTVKKFKEQIAWLDKFIQDWDKASDADDQRQMDDLTAKIQRWCKRQNLDHKSADEMRAELADQMDCTEQGKF